VGHEYFRFPAINSLSLSLSLFAVIQESLYSMARYILLASEAPCARSINVPITETDMFIQTLAAEAVEWIPIAVCTDPRALASCVVIIYGA